MPASTLSARLQLCFLSSVCALACQRSGPPAHGEIEIVRVASFEEEDESVGHPLSFLRIDDGRQLALLHDDDARRIYFFSPDGRRLGSFGRRGSGPGEFRFASRLAAVGDTLIVMDPIQGRHTLLSPAHELIETRDIPLRTANLVFLADGVIAAGSVRVPDRVGYPLHLLDRTGTVLRSFGTDTPSYRLDKQFLTARMLARRPDGRSFWAARRTEYLLELWSPTGRLLRTVRRNPELFAAHEDPPGIRHDHGAPKPTIGALHEDGEERLWVAVHVADPEWERAFRENPATGAMEFEDDWDQLFDTVLDVLNARTGALLGSRQVDQYVTGFTGSAEAEFHSITFSDALNPRIDLWRAELGSR